MNNYNMEFEKLRNIIAQVMAVKPGEITLETRFVEDLGADSLNVYEIVMNIESEFNIEIRLDNVEKINTVEEALALIMGPAGRS